MEDEEIDEFAIEIEEAIIEWREEIAELPDFEEGRAIRENNNIIEVQEVLGNG